jgi:hypothetical protein
VRCTEYINPYIGYELLSQQILAQAYPQMLAPMEWHFAEVAEHKQVAFDVYKAVAPGHWMHALGTTSAQSTGRGSAERAQTGRGRAGAESRAYKPSASASAPKTQRKAPIAGCWSRSLRSDARRSARSGPSFPGIGPAMKRQPSESWGPILILAYGATSKMDYSLRWNDELSGHRPNNETSPPAKAGALELGFAGNVKMDSSLRWAFNSRMAGHDERRAPRARIA